MLTLRLAPLLIALVVAMPLAAVPALAQDSSADPSAAQYDPPIPDSGAAESESSEGESGLESEIGFLPFTGLDLLVIAGVAIVLTGIGFALRRLSDPSGPLT